MTARDSYATTLKSAGKSKDEISEMLGHSNSIVTEHYPVSLDVEKTFKIIDCLFLPNSSQIKYLLSCTEILRTNN